MTITLANEVRAVLLDIEGTTTPIAFVHEVLFSYARTHLREFLEKHLQDHDVQSDVELLRAEAGTNLTDNLEALTKHINSLIDLDRKSTGLKSLQGKIWQQGYADGSLQAQVFADVAAALARWRVAGLSINIFSSGSVLAQQLLFGHTEAGDLTPFINNYFDTSVGRKGEAGSYRRIAETIGVEANEVLFISDVVTELAAAREAGMGTLLSLRPGNQPQQSAEQYETIRSFDEIE